MSARLIQVIETDNERRGKGTEDDPVRRIVQYWSTDGILLAEVDPVPTGAEKRLRRADDE